LPLLTTAMVNSYGPTQLGAWLVLPDLRTPCGASVNPPIVCSFGLPQAFGGTSVAMILTGSDLAVQLVMLTVVVVTCPGLTALGLIVSAAAAIFPMVHPLVAGAVVAAAATPVGMSSPAATVSGARVRRCL